MLRIALPLCGVGLIIGFLLGIAEYADTANRRGVLGLSNTLLDSTRERVSLEVSAYLQPASHATLLAHTMLGRGGATTHAEEADAFASSVLEDTTQIANVLFADSGGNFMLVTRSPGGPPGFTDTKRIQITPTERTVRWQTRDADGQVVAEWDDPNDTYDARTRSWFTGARAASDVFWSSVYIFFTTGAPGITAAVHGPDPDRDVVGVDIRLDELSRFLGSLKIGQTGRAYISSRDGQMIAGPDPAHILQRREGSLVPATIDQVGDRDLLASWDHYRTSGPGNRIIEANDRRLISIVTPLATTGGDWLLFITVPESEFSGFVTTNTRRAATMALGVVVLALGFAVLLVRQGLRADRADRAVAERSRAVQQQSAAFARLASETGMFESSGEPPKALTETLSEATGARRAGIWRLSGQDQRLRCDDSFERATGGHVAGLELSRQEMPLLFEALTQGDTIDAPDARHDRRTAALYASLMDTFGARGVYIVPVMRLGRALGVVMLEDARTDPAAVDFARACATLVGLAVPEDATSRRAPAEPTQPAPIETVADRQGLDPTLAASDNPDLSGRKSIVLVLTFSDTTAVTTEQIASAAQEIAARHAIPYVKMLGTKIVASAGYETGGPAEFAPGLADAAIALRECCQALLGDDERVATFGLGLDVGSVDGTTVGTNPTVFNLWGEAVRGADDLAISAPAHTIQASEQVYLLLRRDFLFRPRGRFYRRGSGETLAYVLAGRA